jgi:hypothetical protein
MRQISNPPHPKMPVRFWTELAAGIVSAVAVAITSVWPQWIEDVFGADPDAGSGQAEWGITAGLCAFAVVMFVLARREWKRAAIGRSLG